MTSPDWKAEYEKVRPRYVEYANSLRGLVETIIRKKVDVVQVDRRAKTVESFAEKIGRKAGKYADPLKEMTDLVGIRVIAYYVEDVDQIVELLRAQFDVLEEHSANKQDALAPDQFGYASNHLVIRLGESRRGLPEWELYSDVAVEIQVRTTLQHAWASVDHKLSYKRIEEVPASLKRQLFRLSALFEMADEQFSAIRNSTRQLSHEYTDNVKRGDLEIRIDADSIDAYIRNSPRVALIVHAAAASGVEVSMDSSESSRSNLILLAGHLGAVTIEEFDRLLPDEVATVRKALIVMKEVAQIDDPWFTTVYLFLTDICLVLHPVTREFFDSTFTGWDTLVEEKARMGSQG
ncbi:hypothetical protein [Lentzea sp. NPDC003310]|uniref:GTP pyrophosphokinase n=1 Tax=Lentzea sp. NPDC003310 TaxID=3154447 RepID=UPI0033B4A74C